MKPYTPFIVIIIGGFIMKRMLLFFLLVSCAAALAFAQENNRREHNRFPEGMPPAFRGHDFNRGFPRAAAITSVSGNFTVAQGMIAVTSNDTTYLVRGLNRFIGFIDGLKEGAAGTLEGYAQPYPQNEKIKFLLVRKMTLNGKEYDLAPGISARHSRNAAPKHGVMPPQRYPYPRMWDKR
jgi:hypothetical protein